MKVNKIFHWLYFLMLLLPIFAIPMYAIYVRNENSTFAQEITVQENKVVDFNQLLNNSDFHYENYGVDVVCLNNTYIFNGSNTVSWIGVRSFDIELKYNHKYLNYYYPIGANITDGIYLQVNIQGNYYLSNDIFIYNGGTYSVVLQIGTEGQTFNNTSFNCCLFDLTQMFGIGNEPTYQQFRQWYPNDYYEYTLSDKQLLKDYQQTTYNDTDVGSQFTYTIYNSIYKYFNYDKVFNFGDLYDWLQLNFFNGNAPIGFFIFWHHLIYFLLTSLLWLLFDVLMYVPNLIHKWLDKAS